MPPYIEEGDAAGVLLLRLSAFDILWRGVLWGSGHAG
jgi:hypothetical protein